MTYPDLSDLDAVNAEVNAAPYVPRADAEWLDICKAGSGVCRDYVLGKLHRLLDLGWPIESLQAGECLVEGEHRVDGETHLVLLVEGRHVLDNRWPDVLTLGELHLIGYDLLKIQREGGARQFVEWKWA